MSPEPSLKVQRPDWAPALNDQGLRGERSGASGSLRSIKKDRWGKRILKNSARKGYEGSGGTLSFGEKRFFPACEGYSLGAFGGKVDSLVACGA